MADQSQETTIALLLEKQKMMEEHLRATDAAVAALVSDRSKALLWGITVLGGAVMAMGAWIFNFVTGHIK